MLKLASTVLIATLALFVSTTPSYASLLKIQKTGTIEMNVLSAEDEVDLSVPKRDSLEVKEISNAEVSVEAVVSGTIGVSVRVDLLQ